jgi:hypothetical protein
MLPSSRKFLCAPLAVAALFAVSTVSAAVIGTVNIDVPGNGGVVVSATSTIFLPAAANANYGIFQVNCISTPCNDAETNLTYTGTGGTTFLTSGEQGDILDLTLANAPAIGMAGGLANFITLQPTVPTSSFSLSLTALGGGQVTNDCETFTLNVGCSPTITIGMVSFESPYVLKYLGIGLNGLPTTDVSLKLGGVATDASGQASLWNGGLTTQVSLTPKQIEDIINGGGSVTASYSGIITATFTPVPEPGTWSLMLGGVLTGVAALLRRKRPQV